MRECKRQRERERARVRERERERETTYVIRECNNMMGGGGRKEGVSQSVSVLPI